MSKKVYCENCKYYNGFCNAPFNLIHEEISLKGTYSYRQMPNEINRYNNCRAFKRAWGRKFIRLIKRFIHR
jgi:hypothetical protein